MVNCGHLLYTLHSTLSTFPEEPMIRTGWLFACFIASTIALFAQKDSTSKDTTVYTAPNVVVTSVRTEENILEAPLAITVVPEQILQSQRGFGMEDALSLVPGVLAQSRTGNADARIQVRGFGARGAGERSNAGTSRGVRFYQDGIPETEPDGRTAFDIINMTHASRVEVIRSNASTLWGNASGGVISISTVPTDKSAFIEIGGGVGSFGYNKLQLLANAPLSGGGQIYLSLADQHTDGWRTHSTSDLTQGTLGIITNVGLNTSFKAFITGAWNQFSIPGALTSEEFADDPQQGQDNTAVYNPTYVARDEMRNNKLGRIGAIVDHHFDESNELSVTTYIQSKYLQRSERNTWRDFNRYHFGGNLVYTNSTEFSESVSNKLLAGSDLQYQDGAILFYNLDTNGSTSGRDVGRGTTLRDNKREGAMNLGFFLQDEISFDKLHVTAGVRYDNITYYSESYINPNIDTSRLFSRLTPKLGISYQVSNMLNLYANLGGGIEVPAGNETDPPAVDGMDTLTAINPLLEPIISTTYEIGSKGISEVGEDFIRSVSYDVAAYMISIQNDIVPYRGGRFYQTAGESRRIGVELGGVIQTKPGLTLFASATMMQTEFVDYVIDSGYIDPAKAGNTVVYNGNEIPGIATFFASARLRYDLPILTGLFVETEIRNVGSYFADDANTITVDGYTILDAAIGGAFNVVPERLDLNVLLRANNLTGASYMASAWINPDHPSGGTPYIEPGLPMNFFGNVTLRYHL